MIKIQDVNHSTQGLTMINIKLVDNRAVVTVHNPKLRNHYSRPLSVLELALVSEYGEEAGLNLLDTKNYKIHSVAKRLGKVWNTLDKKPKVTNKAA